MRLPLLNSLTQRRATPHEARSLGPLELELLQKLWDCAEMTVRDMHDTVRDRLAYTTVMTTLDRLYKKGFLSRKQQGRAFLYSAAVTRTDFCAMTMRHALASMFTYAHPKASDAVSYFVEAIGESDERLLDELERAVRERRRKERH